MVIVKDVIVHWYHFQNVIQHNVILLAENVVLVDLQTFAAEHYHVNVSTISVEALIVATQN